MDVILMS